MNDSFLRVFQRGIRSNLSFCFNKKEYINPKIKSLIHLVFKMSDEIVISKKSNRKKTHKIFTFYRKRDLFGLVGDGNLILSSVN